MKLKELEVNKIYTIPLVVIGATARETKTKKPYLAMEFFDGVDSINGNFWDWTGKGIPDKNAILDVTAQVTEWQGTPQLNIKKLVTNTELHISEFTPGSGADISAIYKEAYSMVSNMQDDLLRSLGLGVLEELQSRWLTAPGAVTIHHAYTAGTLIHSVSTAKIAGAIAAVTDCANHELTVLSALLHDLGKLFGYHINGIICEMTDEGMLYEHSFIGAEFVGNYAEENGLIKSEADEAKLEMLRHIILSHHGKREYGVAIPPGSIEAHIVHHADALDATMEQVREASGKAGNVKWTERIWALDNRPHLTTNYVRAVMAQHE